MRALTEKQARILRFIRDKVERQGCPPSVREIARRFRFASTNAVRCHLAALEKKGFIERRGHEARGIRLAERSSGIPIVGRVAAGRPITAIENIEGYLSPQDIAASGRGLYSLRVQGDSMIRVGIMDGDYVIVRPKPDFDNGEIGVAVIDEEATVKRLKRKGHVIQLLPENESMSRLVIDATRSSFRYAGEVVGVFRALGSSVRKA